MGPLKRTVSSRNRVVGAVMALAMLTAPFSTPARAQVRAFRTLRSISVEETDTGWVLDLRLEIPVRYLRQVPARSGMSIRIQVDPLRLGQERRGAGPIREELPIPPNSPAPLVEIAFDSRSPLEPFIEFQFSKRLRYDVRQGADLQTIRLTVHDPAVEPAPLPHAPPTVEDGSKAAGMLARAKISIRDGELDLAISLLNRILESDSLGASDAIRQQARELVGVTRERRGQLAHAIAEYDLYLEEYPEGEAADRVRQRRDALVTASSQPMPSLRRSRKKTPTRVAPGGKRPIDYELFGSLAIGYFRAESMFEEAGDEFLATDVLTDADIASRIEADDWAIRSDFTATYDADVAGEGRSNDFRVSRLSIELEDKIHGLEAIIGRQRRSDSGVLGRFDGLSLRSRLGSKFAVSALVGLPVESTSDSEPNTDTILAGGAIDFEGVGWEGLSGQLFAVGRSTASMTDRAAIGGELRFSNPKTYSFLYLDYDVVFNSLNTVILSGTYYWTERTDFRVLIERRNSPVLTLGSALLGQPEDDLDSLKRRLSESEIRDLAEDRTTVLWTGMAGVTHRPVERLQISADLTLIHTSDTETSGGVMGIDSSGPDVSTSLQFLLNDWLIENGVGTITLRYFEGERTRAFSFYGFSRFPLFENVRLNPLLRWEWRDSDTQGGRSSLRPSLEGDWRIGPVLLSAEGGIEWVEPISGATLDRDTSYFVELGARWEF